MLYLKDELWLFPFFLSLCLSFLRLLLYFYLKYLGVCLHVCLCEDVRSPGTGVTGGCEPPCEGWEQSSGPLQEHQVLPTTEPPLQPSNNNTFNEKDFFSNYKPNKNWASNSLFKFLWLKNLTLGWKAIKKLKCSKYLLNRIKWEATICLLFFSFSLLESGALGMLGDIPNPWVVSNSSLYSNTDGSFSLTLFSWETTFITKA